ncbi:MAG: hypothetical protein AAB425_08220, partial [Bdellovibrionota bacterium]
MILAPLGPVFDVRISAALRAHLVDPSHECRNFPPCHLRKMVEGKSFFLVNEIEDRLLNFRHFMPVIGAVEHPERLIGLEETRDLTSERPERYFAVGRFSKILMPDNTGKDFTWKNRARLTLQASENPGLNFRKPFPVRLREGVHSPTKKRMVGAVIPRLDDERSARSPIQAPKPN